MIRAMVFALLCISFAARAGSLSCILSPSFSFKIEWQKQESDFEYTFFQNGLQVAKEKGGSFLSLEKNQLQNDSKVGPLVAAAKVQLSVVETAKIFDVTGDGSLIIGSFFDATNASLGAGFVTDMQQSGTCK